MCCIQAASMSVLEIAASRRSASVCLPLRRLACGLVFSCLQSAYTCRSGGAGGWAATGTQEPVTMASP
jgi:hypothetical protein